MTTHALLDSTLPDGRALTAGQKGALDQFENTLGFCIGQWYDGKTSVILSDNIQERFGTMLASFFQRTLVSSVGMPVTLTLVNNGDGSKTHVQMPNRMVSRSSAEMQLTVSSLTETSEQNAVDSSTSATGVKKAPRPMNCWIIFREQMHRQLKQEFPDISVQDICKHIPLSHFESRYANFKTAKRCSETWRDLSPDQKKPFKLAAQSAKEEHMRLHPNYKYSPRKPGEKKKRQSRKAKQAAAAAAAATAESQSFDVPSVPDMTLTTLDTTGTFTAASGENNTTNDNIFVGDFASLVDQSLFFGLELDGLAVGNQLHDSESLRHDRLQAEMGAELDANIPFELFGDEPFAFRAGANSNATLPTIYYDDGY
jgi:hypothetical protein